MLMLISIVISMMLMMMITKVIIIPIIIMMIMVIKVMMIITITGARSLPPFVWRSGLSLQVASSSSSCRASANGASEVQELEVGHELPRCSSPAELWRAVAQIK